MNESENQFSRTRVAPSTSGRAKNQSPITKTVLVVIFLGAIVLFVVGCCLFATGDKIQQEAGWAGSGYAAMHAEAETYKLWGVGLTLLGLLPFGCLFLAILQRLPSSSHRGEVQISGKDDYGNPVKVWIRTEKD